MLNYATGTRTLIFSANPAMAPEIKNRSAAKAIGGNRVGVAFALSLQPAEGLVFASPAKKGDQAYWPSSMCRVYFKTGAEGDGEGRHTRQAKRQRRVILFREL